MGNFAHLHVHTEYSLLDGAARINKVIAKAVELKMPAIAMTDHGNMYGAIQFYKACIKANQDACKEERKEAGLPECKERCGFTCEHCHIKPIIGCEFYVCDDLKRKSGRGDDDLDYSQTGRNRGGYDHLVLLAKSEKGYRNIVKLDSIAFVDGFYYKPRIDYSLLKKYSEDVICLTACLAGRLQKLLLMGLTDEAEKFVDSLHDIYGDDLYIELQDHGLPEQKMVNPLLIRLARKKNIKLVATNDVHYVNKSDSEMHDVLLCMQTGKTLNDENRMRFPNAEFYLKSEEEMNDVFASVPEAVTNTMEIVDKCNLKLSFKMDLIPNFVPPDGSTPKEYLKALMEKGLKDRYPVITKEIRERADYEFDTIASMGYVEYYLIVWDFINYARMHDIPVGYGRGSGVGSIVAYAVGITNVEPLRYNLLFERFLNRERVSMPDFDIDFCCERRGEVIQYVIDKYGSDNVAQIVTFGCLKSRAAVKDVARVYNLPFSEVNKITKLIPSQPALHATLAKLFGKEKVEDSRLVIPELRELYDENEELKKVIDIAIEVEGMPKNTSKHAAGVIICKEKISDFVPLQRNSPLPEDVTIQYTMIEAEELGLLKMDFLGLTNLTDIKKAVTYVKEQHDVDIDFKALGDTDPEVYKLISSGDTDAVFQLESAGMKKFMQQLKPQSMEDIIAGISLFRPGPMDSIPEFIEAKNSGHIHFSTPLLEDILGVTYGVIIYQEQVMQIVQKLAGYSLGQADIIRRAMSKKKVKEMDIHRKLFVYGGEEPTSKARIEGAIARGVDEKVALELFEKMAKFAAYAFNKSHAAAYATVSYQTAFLKRYYPVEFLCAVLNNRITKSEEITKYTSYAKERGIDVLPPDINKSKTAFSVENGSIRFGLGAIKNVGGGVVDEIIAERKRGGEFTSMQDLFKRAWRHLNKRMIENMIFAGAFDCFHIARSKMMGAFPLALDMISKDEKNAAEGQFSLFHDFGDEQEIEIKYPSVKEYDNLYKLSKEKEVLGVYVSGHPLDSYRDKLDKLDFSTRELIPLDEIEGDEDDEVDTSEFEGRRVAIGGMLKEISRTRVKSSQKEMAYGRLEDLYGIIDVVFFPRVFEKYRELVHDDSLVVLNGMLTVKNDTSYQINVDMVRALSDEGKEEVAEGTKTLYMRVATAELLDKIQDILINYEGESPVIVKCEGKALKLPYKVFICDSLEKEMNLLLSESDIVIK